MRRSRSWSTGGSRARCNPEVFGNTKLFHLNVKPSRTSDREAIPASISPISPLYGQVKTKAYDGDGCLANTEILTFRQA